MQDIICGWTESNQQALKAAICSPGTDKVLPHIITLKDPPTSFDPNLSAKDNLFFDDEYQTYEVFVDESLKDNKASFGVYFADNHPWNIGSWTAGKQDLQASTCQGIIYVLQKFPPDANICIYIDREAVLTVLQQLLLPLQKQYKTQGVALFNQISFIWRN